jgi:hypothetical protein
MGIPVRGQDEVISNEIRSRIAIRYKTVTRSINKAFWDAENETLHSLYVGSYGRGTAIDDSDIDILVELPETEYNRFDTVWGNGQSRLLQAVRGAILESYPRSDVRADGQVVKIVFSDGMKFDVLPAFKRFSYYGTWDGKYTYPDSNMGGNWLSTNPKAEQDAIQEKNKNSNGLLKDTCKHFRSIRNNYFGSYHLSGIVIDSFVYAAIQGWRWNLDSQSSSAAEGDYERALRAYLEKMSPWYHLESPGSGQALDTSKSIDCLIKVVDLIAGN